MIGKVGSIVRRVAVWVLTTAGDRRARIDSSTNGGIPKLEKMPWPYHEEPGP